LSIAGNTNSTGPYPVWAAADDDALSLVFQGGTGDLSEMK
jgi:hypothetical protein